MVTRHMRNEGAPEQNIAKMTEIFCTELTHRITRLLAERVDTAAKVEESVKAVVAACVSLHSAELDEDIIGRIITSLHYLKGDTTRDATDSRQISADINTSPTSTQSFIMWSAVMKLSVPMPKQKLQQGELAYSTAM